MKITVKNKPVAKVMINLVEFKNHMMRYFDLKQAVEESASVLEYEEPFESDERVIDALHLYADWGNLITNIKLTKQEYIEFNFFACEVNGATIYDPEKIDGANGIYVFKDIIRNSNDLLLVNSFNPLLEKHIEHMIGGMLIDYANKTPKMVVDL